MTFLDTLTPDWICSNSLPISEILENSVYYPSSHFDGAVLKAYAHDYQSFVYCDYGVTEADLLAQLQTFRGYDVLAHRSVQPQEMIPSGWQPQIPHQLLVNYEKYQDYIKTSFAYWAVYERKPEYSDMHGPTRFSILFIGGEGVATYQALYWSNKATAKAIAIIRPGTGFGFNWTNFLDGEKALGYVVMKNQYGTPDFVISDSKNLLTWRNYPRPTSERSCRFSRDRVGYFYEYSSSLGL